MGLASSDTMLKCGVRAFNLKSPATWEGLPSTLFIYDYYWCEISCSNNYMTETVQLIHQPL